MPIPAWNGLVDKTIDLHINGNQVLMRKDLRSQYAAGAIQKYLEKQDLERISSEYNINQAFPLRIQIAHLGTEYRTPANKRRHRVMTQSRKIAGTEAPAGNNTADNYRGCYRKPATGKPQTVDPEPPPNLHGGKACRFRHQHRFAGRRRATDTGDKCHHRYPIAHRL